MKTPKSIEFGKAAILAIAEIKAAIAAFDRGDTNAFDVLEAVRAAAAARCVTIRPRLQRARRRAA
ncbi:MAG: hypothetical protein ACKOZU_03280 [Planctomycetaceae bacterium]